jgi:hypothetical protein
MYSVPPPETNFLFPTADGAEGSGPMQLLYAARVCAGDDVALTGLQDLDGDTGKSGDWVLCPTQTDASENGIYVMLSDAWQRVGRLFPGALVSVRKGDAFGNSLWMCITDPSAVLDTDDIIFKPVVGGPKRQLKIHSIETNYLNCHTWDGSVLGTNLIKVAMPPLVKQVAAWNGMTYAYSAAQERVATLGGATETQVPVPLYVVDDIIYAELCECPILAVSGENIWLLDINDDARAWCKKTGT